MPSQQPFSVHAQIILHLHRSVSEVSESQMRTLFFLVTDHSTKIARNLVPRIFSAFQNGGREKTLPKSRHFESSRGEDPGDDVALSRLILTSGWLTAFHQSSSDGHGFSGPTRVDTCSPTKSTSFPSTILERMSLSSSDSSKRTSVGCEAMSRIRWTVFHLMNRTP